jgi:hypothetical protein
VRKLRPSSPCQRKSPDVVCSLARGIRRSDARGICLSLSVRAEGEGLLRADAVLAVETLSEVPEPVAFREETEEAQGERIFGRLPAS